MELKDIVVSLNLARDLEKHGYPKDTLFRWILMDIAADRYEVGLTEVYEENAKYFSNPPSIAAPTSSELRQYMPEEYDVIKTIIGYQGSHFTEDEILQLGLWTEQKDADAYARLWLYLKKNNLLKE